MVYATNTACLVAFDKSFGFFFPESRALEKQWNDFNDTRSSLQSILYILFLNSRDRFFRSCLLYRGCIYCITYPSLWLLLALVVLVSAGAGLVLKNGPWLSFWISTAVRCTVFQAIIFIYFPLFTFLLGISNAGRCYFPSHFILKIVEFVKSVSACRLPQETARNTMYCSLSLWVLDLAYKSAWLPSRLSLKLLALIARLLIITTPL